MKVRDERSRGIVTHIADTFVIIKPTAPFKLAKHETLRKRNWSDSSDNSLVKDDDSRWVYKNKRRINSSYKCPVVLFIITEEARSKERKWDGVGVMKDKEMKFEDVKTPHTLKKVVRLVYFHLNKKGRKPRVKSVTLKLWWVENPIKLSDGYPSCVS